MDWTNQKYIDFIEDYRLAEVLWDIRNPNYKNNQGEQAGGARDSMLEVCVESLGGANAAERGGADHIELCSSLAEGGLTPSAGLLTVVQRVTSNVKINVMIRCRRGSDFHYSHSEIETMLADIEIFNSMRVDGFVFGALTEYQEIDKTACAKVINKAGSTPVTFHRAFDACRDPLKSVETIIELGFKKLLTSGQRPSACDPQAVSMIEELIKKANGRITIMPGAGITDENVGMLAESGAKYFHSSCKVSKSLLEVEAPAMGTNESKTIYVTDEGKVMKLKNVLKELFHKD